MGEPLKVLVTGAAGQIAYSLLGSIAKGEVFGPEQRVTLVMLDIAPMMGVLEGVVMELDDCAFPLLAGTVASCNEAEAFVGVDVAILVGAMPRREGMERKDLLAANVKIFKSMGMSIDQQAKKTIKVLVVGNPANTNCQICMKYAPSIPKANFSALTRLDQNRAQAQVAAKVGVTVQDVKNMVIWGNHSSTQYPDARHGSVTKNGVTGPATEAVQDDSWLNNEFVATVQQRGGAVIKARKLSSAMSAAKAIGDHMRDWWFGTAEGAFTSMAVLSDGNPYGMPDGLVYSFPVTVATDRSWTIVPGLPISDFARAKMEATAAELVEERDLALSVCQD